MIYWTATFMARSRDWRINVPIVCDTFLLAVYEAERFRRERMPKGHLIGVAIGGVL